MGWGIFKSKKKIRIGLPESSTPKVIIQEAHGDITRPRLHLRVPIEICDSMGFEETRRQARLIIKDIERAQGLTEEGFHDLLAAMIFEIIDQGYTGG